MRPASELKDRNTLGRSLLAFAQGFRSLIIPSPTVLADTVLVLHQLAHLSDKVLPLKSYFNVAQEIQRTAFLAKRVAEMMTESMPSETAEQIKTREARILALEFELRSQGAAQLSRALAEGAERAEGILPEQKVEFDRRQEQRIAQDSQRVLCTEDVFMVACAFLQVDIAKQGSIYYLRGESPEFRETKKNRNPIDLLDEVTLKHLSAGLARPDAERGAVERGQIDSGFNHIVRLNRLHIVMTDVIRWIKAAEREGRQCRKVDVRKHFELSHTDYERIMSQARREGLISFRNRTKDPANNFTLRNHNFDRVLAYAEKFGHSPNKTLNKIVDDFFELLEAQRRKQSGET